LGQATLTGTEQQQGQGDRRWQQQEAMQDADRRAHAAAHVARMGAAAAKGTGERRASQPRKASDATGAARPETLPPQQTG